MLGRVLAPYEVGIVLREFDACVDGFSVRLPVGQWT
jgi:hypothetical protein